MVRNLRNLEVLIKRFSAEIVVFLIILVAFFIRINFFHYPFESTDPNRDYLVGHYMIRDHTLPINGPVNEILSQYGVKNSPVYFYLIAFILLIYDNVFFLYAFNLSLQLASIFIIYFFTKELFGKISGLIAASIYAFSISSIIHSNYILMPNLMEPFLNLSLFLLFIFFIKGNTKALYVGTALFLFASAIHVSALSLGPMIFAGVFYKLFKSKKIKHLIKVIGLLIFLFVVWFSPPVIYSLQNNNFHFSSGFLSVSAGELINKLAENFISLFNLIFIFNNPGNLELKLLALAFFISVCFIFIFSRDREAKNYWLSLLLLCIQYILLLSLFVDKASFRYFTSILGIFCVVISAPISKILFQTKISAPFGLFLTLLIVYTASVDLSVFKDSKKYINLRELQNIAESIFRETKKIGGDSFQIELKHGGQWGYSGEIIHEVENLSGKKLAQIDNSSFENIRQLNKDNYVFLVCKQYINPTFIKEHCINFFLSSSLSRGKKYKLLKNIYNNVPHYEVFLMAKE